LQKANNSELKNLTKWSLIKKENYDLTKHFNTMVNKKPILKLKNQNSSTTGDKLNTIISKIDGNPKFSTIDLTVTKKKGNVLAIKTTEKNVAKKAYQQKVLEEKIAIEDVKNNLMEIGAAVHLIAKGNETIILEAGFDVRSDFKTIGMLKAPLGVLATEGPGSGMVQCKWRKVSGAVSYNVELTTDVANDNSWKTIASLTKTSCIVDKLQPGTLIWMRVAAVGAAGTSAPSDVTKKIVA
jgi:hypothetical protein